MQHECVYYKSVSASYIFYYIHYTYDLYYALKDLDLNYGISNKTKLHMIN